MRSINVLVLTDHLSHSKENSFYSLVNALFNHSGFGSIHIASRGEIKNRDFFEAVEESSLFGNKVSSEIHWSQNSSCFFDPQQIGDRAFDLILMRLPHPISVDWLKWIENKFPRAVFVNKPTGIIETGNKRFLLGFQELCPPMKLCMDEDSIRFFAASQDIVLKPLRSYGGKGIVRIMGDTVDDGSVTTSLDEFLINNKEEIRKEGFLAMRFLKNVTEGDKRIIVIGEEIVAASLRLPPSDSWLCNVSQGGRSQFTDVTPEEISIVETLSKELLPKGILIYGVDTLVDDEGRRVLSEINTLSIGGFPQAQIQSGRPVLKMTSDKIFNYVNDELARISAY